MTKRAEQPNNACKPIVKRHAGKTVSHANNRSARASPTKRAKPKRNARAAPPNKQSSTRNVASSTNNSAYCKTVNARRMKRNAALPMQERGNVRLRSGSVSKPNVSS
jgi:hypothetical protein